MQPSHFHPLAIAFWSALAVLLPAGWAGLHLIGRRAKRTTAVRVLFAARVLAGFGCFWMLIHGLSWLLMVGGGWTSGLVALSAAAATEAVIWLSAAERKTLAPRIGRWLLGLRLSLVLLLLCVLLQPVISYETQTRHERFIAVLVDDSASMQLTDPQSTPSEKLGLARLYGRHLRRSAEPAGPVAGATGGSPPGIGIATRRTEGHPAGRRRVGRRADPPPPRAAGRAVGQAQGISRPPIAASWQVCSQQGPRPTPSSGRRCRRPSRGWRNCWPAGWTPCESSWSPSRQPRWPARWNRSAARPASWPINSRRCRSNGSPCRPRWTRHCTFRFLLPSERRLTTCSRRRGRRSPGR